MYIYFSLPLPLHLSAASLSLIFLSFYLLISVSLSSYFLISKQVILGGPAATFELYDKNFFKDFRNQNLVRAVMEYAQVIVS